MGYIRLILAFSVFQGHAWAIFPPRVYEFSGGVVSVRLFYMISGFLIALVIHSKYKSAKNFYKSRILRLSPVYLIIFSLTIVVSFLSYILIGNPFLLGYFLGYLNFLNPFEIILLLAPQFSPIGLDLYGFLGINESGVFITERSWKYVNGYQFLIVPQSWTLGLECWYYLLAPFVIKRTNLIIYLLIFSFGIEFVISASLDYSHDDPWFRRFFPSELKYFLAGALSFKIKFNLKPESTKSHFGILVLVLISICLIDYLQFQLYSVFVYLLFFIALPSMASLSRHLPFDRIIGDLSYPFYLSHWVILHAVHNQFIPSLGNPKVLSFIYSILLSVSLVLLVERKIDRIRSKYIS